MMQKDTQYKAVKDNESKLLNLIEMFKKQLKEIEKNSEDKEKKLRCPPPPPPPPRQLCLFVPLSNVYTDREEIKAEVEKRNKLNQRIEEEKDKCKKAVEEMQGMLSEHRLGEEQLSHIKKLMKEAEDRNRDALQRAERDRQEIVDALERTKAERERDREQRGKLQAKIKKFKELLKQADKQLGESRQKVATRDEELATFNLQMEALRREVEAAAQRVEAERAETEKRVTIEVKAKAREDFLQQLRKAAQVYKEKMKELVRTAQRHN
jgi:chromosome segregation ATPase